MLTVEYSKGVPQDGTSEHSGAIIDISFSSSSSSNAASGESKPTNHSSVTHRVTNQGSDSVDISKKPSNLNTPSSNRLSDLKKPVRELTKPILQTRSSDHNKTTSLTAKNSSNTPFSSAGRVTADFIPDKPHIPKSSNDVSSAAVTGVKVNGSSLPEVTSNSITSSPTLHRNASVSQSGASNGQGRIKINDIPSPKRTPKLEQRETEQNNGKQEKESYVIDKIPSRASDSKSRPVAKVSDVPVSDVPATSASEKNPQSSTATTAQSPSKTDSSVTSAVTNVKSADEASSTKPPTVPTVKSTPIISYTSTKPSTVSTGMSTHETSTPMVKSTGGTNSSTPAKSLDDIPTPANKSRSQAPAVKSERSNENDLMVSSFNIQVLCRPLKLCTNQ